MSQVLLRELSPSVAFIWKVDAHIHRYAHLLVLLMLSLRVYVRANSENRNSIHSEAKKKPNHHSLFFHDVHFSLACSYRQKLIVRLWGNFIEM